MKPIVSIVIPVYQTEKYIDQCLSSIIHQTYREVEVILIDDGSTDSSPQICDEWANKDERIKVIHKLNGGLSSARNKGLDVACGKYVLFCDSDDFLHSKAIEQILEVAEKSNADISCFKFRFFDDGEFCPEKEEELEFREEIRTFTENEWYTEVIKGTAYGGYSCNKLFLRSTIEQEKPSRYDEKIKHLEDQPFAIELASKAKKIVCIDEKLYYYRQRKGSILHSKFSANSATSIYAREHILKLLEQKNCSVEIRNMAWNNLMKAYCISAKKFLFSSLENKNQWLKYIMRGFKKRYRQFLPDQSWNLKERIYFMLCSLFCHIYGKV